jgi:hypothetical protein
VTDETPWAGGRTWTPAQAAAAIPLVRRIADDLTSAFRRWQQAVEAFEYAASGSSVNAPSTEADRLMADAQRLATEVDGYERELAKLDIRVAQVSHGLLAFRSERGGDVVPLYWAPGLGEPGYDWPDSVPENGTSISWPSRAHDVAAKRSRA